MKTIENKEAKYSEMIIELVNAFDEQLPKEWNLEDTFGIGIEAWNLANRRNNLGEKAYKNTILKHKLSAILHEMVEYKQNCFSDYSNIIVDFSTVDDRLQIKSQKPKAMFDDLIKMMVTKPKKVEKE